MATARDFGSNLEALRVTTLGFRHGARGPMRKWLLEDSLQPNCLLPNTREYFAEVTENLSPEVRRNIVQDNAASAYGITIPAHG